MLESVRNAHQNGETLALVVVALAGALLLLLLLTLGLLLHLRRISRRLHALTRGADGDLEQVLAAHLTTVDQTVRRMESLEQAVGVLQAQLPGCFQKFSVSRYDAFEDVGGEQSFSLALLNAQGDGLVLTSVYSRMDVRVYAKAVQDGRASHALSKEEERLLRELASKG